MTKNKQGYLGAVFAGLVTGAASGITFGASVEYISDLLGHSLTLPETLLNGFTIGTIPAAAMTGSAYLGAYILDKVSRNPKINTYATAHIAAVIIGGYFALGHDIGATDNKYVYTRGIYDPPAQSHPDFEPLLRALHF